MTIKGSIVELKSRTDASGNQVQSVKLEVFGDFKELHALMQKALTITFDEA